MVEPATELTSVEAPNQGPSHGKRTMPKSLAAVDVSRTSVRHPNPIFPGLFEKQRKALRTGQLLDATGRLNISPIVLRDRCQCEKCIDPSTGQRDFLASNIPSDITAHIEATSEDGTIDIRWEHDVPGYEHHISKYAVQQVADILKTNAERRWQGTYAWSLWRRKEIERRVQRISYDDYMNHDAGLAKVLLGLHRDGLVFVKDVPSDPKSVRNIAERIGPLRNTFYGETWDVRSVVDSKNVAYTNKNLGFHMDLLYMRK